MMYIFSFKNNLTTLFLVISVLDMSPKYCSIQSLVRVSLKSKFEV